MRPLRTVAVLVLAAACWLAAGPGCATVRAIILCTHHAVPHGHAGHGSVPANGPCFCDQMTGGPDLAVSAAVPAAPLATPVVALPERVAPRPALFPLPLSPAFPPTPPPPNWLG